MTEKNKIGLAKHRDYVWYEGDKRICNADTHCLLISKEDAATVLKALLHFESIAIEDCLDVMAKEAISILQGK